jgi:tRNA G18 (ribose-2'-O)-methylase SpoU
LLDQFSHQNIPVEKVDEDVFLSIMDTATSQGIAAICRYSKPTLPSNLDFWCLLINFAIREISNSASYSGSRRAQAVITNAWQCRLVFS